MTSAAAPTGSRRHRLGGRLPALGAAAFWVALPVVCLIMIGLGASRIATHINNVPSGVRGTFVVTTHNCHQKLCITGGTFTSDDKTLVARDLLGVYRWTLGTSHRVVYDVDAADVIQLPARWDPTGASLGIAGAVVLLGIWAWCLRGALRRRSRGPSEANV